ncbi:MAG: MotA/TolQ/ExbB proton channel family protein [Planctomycetes bacterium]|nr:MotA/TolQ/ExbB proton channel family protein [Planctomycetota bacterium]
MWSFLTKGGVFIYPLLACSVVALAIIIERLISLHKIKRNLNDFLCLLGQTIKGKSMNEALKVCEISTLSLARIYHKGISGVIDKLPRDKVRQIFQESSAVELPWLEKGWGILSVIAQVSPLIGFLGTVSGMIRAFQEIQKLAAVGQAIGPGDLAGGIWEALITTVVGLVIAIPAYIMLAYFRSVVGNLTLEMERLAIEIVNYDLVSGLN